MIILASFRTNKSCGLYSFDKRICYQWKESKMLLIGFTFLKNLSMGYMQLKNAESERKCLPQEEYNNFLSNNIHINIHAYIHTYK